MKLVFLSACRSRLTFTEIFLFLDSMEGKMLLCSMLESSVRCPEKRSFFRLVHLENSMLGTCLVMMSGT